MKKRIYVCISVLSIFCILFQSLSYISYRAARESKNKQLESVVQEKGEAELGQATVLPVLQATEVLLQSGAEYVCINYNTVTGDRTREKGSVRSDFVGWTREEVLQYMKDYLENMSEEEKKRGLVSFELLSFSAESLHVKKTYTPKQQYEFLLVVEDNEVIVYDGEWKNIYEKTGIDASMLDEEARKGLSKGIYVKDQEELYSILEDYSS